MPDTRPRVPRSTLAAAVNDFLNVAGCTCAEVELIGDDAPRYGDNNARISIGHDDNCPLLERPIRARFHFMPADPTMS